MENVDVYLGAIILLDRSSMNIISKIKLKFRTQLYYFESVIKQFANVNLIYHFMEWITKTKPILSTVLTIFIQF